MDAKIIQALGGQAEVARKLELDTTKGGVQRVHNWMTRGIPPAIRLAHLNIFGAVTAAREERSVIEAKAKVA